MYILLNDGGAGDPDNTTSCRTDIRLQQRTLVFDMISQGVSVSLLSAVEFRDSKVNFIPGLVDPCAHALRTGYISRYRTEGGPRRPKTLRHEFLGTR